MCVAIAAGVATVATTAYGAYSASQSKQDALDYQKNNTPKMTTYEAVQDKFHPNAGLNSYFSAVNKFGGQAQGVANQENATYLGNAQAQENFNRAQSSDINKYYQQSLNALGPITQNVKTANNIVKQQLSGQLSPDVAQNIARASAQAGLTGGYGAASGMGMNRTARDFGLTSLDLQNQGIANEGRVQGYATALNSSIPQAVQLGRANPYSLFGTPEEFAARSDIIERDNADRLNNQRKDAAGVANQNANAQYQAGLAGVQASDINPYAQGLAGAAGGLVASYNGGVFGGSGSATPASYDNTANATYGGYYNPYKDVGNYSAGGNFYGNPNSYGFTGTG